MEKIEIVNGEFETTATSTENNLTRYIVLVIFPDKSLRECVIKYESEKAVLLSYDTDMGTRNSWWLKNAVEMVETIGFVKKNWRGQFIKNYY